MKPLNFQSFIDRKGLSLERVPLSVLQFNLGKLCNMTCSHCHVEAGPTKIIENADSEVVEAVKRSIDVFRPETLDLTGGAPEMNPHFKELVKFATQKGVKVIDRCNLTIFFEDGFGDIPRFLADHHVAIVASLPCYEKANVDDQRGEGAFDLSIRGLQRLNELGYGVAGTGLELNLVYNPTGPHLPPNQQPPNLVQHPFRDKRQNPPTIPP